MPKVVAGSPEAASIDAKLAEWRQGDLALGEAVFIHAADPRAALTNGIPEMAGDDLAIVETLFDGVVVVTQTCDIRRHCVERPFVEVSPLVAVNNLEEGIRIDCVRKGSHPRYLFVPAIADRGLVGDLDRTMTIEKSVLAGWARTPGCADGAERQSIAAALARKRARFAFPNDFNARVAKLANRIKKKHGNDSDEGHILDGIREIRVAASPDWDATEVTLMFWFLCEQGPSDDTSIMNHMKVEGQVAKWLDLVPAGGRFVQVKGTACALQDMTAAEYVASDRLDLDHLSQ